MARARWLIAPVALVALAGCGSSTDSSTVAPDSASTKTGGTTTIAGTAGAPAVIHLSAGGSPESATDGGATPADQGNGGDGQIEPMPIQPAIVTYVTSGDLPALGGNGPSWRLPSGAQPDQAQIERVARALGVQGEVTRLPADQGGGWIVGSGDTGPSLQVNTDGLLSWWYNPAATAAPEPAKDPGGSDGSAQPAPESPPPAGVPTKDEAIARAGELLTAMGLDPAGYQFEAAADDWGASVTAWQLLDGRRLPLSTNFGFGAGGELTWAGGSLATPVRGPDYPLVSTDSALVRLNDQQTGWLAISGGGTVAARDVATGSGTVSSTGTAQTPGSAAPPEMMPSDEGPDATAATIAAPGPADRAPEPAPPSGASETCPKPVPDVQAPNPGPDSSASSGTHQPLAPAVGADTPCVSIPVHAQPTRLTVTLTGVADDLSSVSDQAGNVWIMPAYTFHDESGATYTVLSVADRYLDLATR